MATNPTTAVLIVAAGRGIRAGSQAIPKQYQMVGGKPMLAWSLAAFLDDPRVARVQVAIGETDRALYEAVAPQNPKLGPAVAGGETRQASVRLGLEALAEAAPANVLIHDAARPFASPDLVGRVLAALGDAEAVVPVLPVSSTLKRVADGRVAETVPREGLEAAETPQGFRFTLIREAHARAAEAGATFTDDAAVAEWAGATVRAVPGDPVNVKLTTATEIASADRRLLAEDALRLGDVRVGIGYDVHPLGAGTFVNLGGVAIPHTRGLLGHSDADVMLHALTDAVLGALGDGDIGTHFPPSEAKWKGAASFQFLAHAVARVTARRGIVAHLDVTYVGEGPKLAPHREAIRERIAEIAGISFDRVAVKATTSEGLGFIGRGEGASAYAVATIRLPLLP